MEVRTQWVRSLSDAWHMKFDVFVFIIPDACNFVVSLWHQHLTPHLLSLKFVCASVEWAKQFTCSSITLLCVPCCKDSTVWYTFVIYSSSPFFMFLVANMAWCGIYLSFSILHPSLCFLLQRWHIVVYLCHLQFLTLLYVSCCKDGMMQYIFVIYNSSPFLIFLVAKMA